MLQYVIKAVVFKVSEVHWCRRKFRMYSISQVLRNTDVVGRVSLAELKCCGGQK
jgi:hypothetical protein